MIIPGPNFESSPYRKYDSIAGGVFYRDPLMLENERYTNVSDLWSLGLVFHEFLTGKHLITGKQLEKSKREEMYDFFKNFEKNTYRIIGI